MATSARTAALVNQRNPYTSFRVLTPRDSKLNSIAKKTATQELAIMVERYNDGLVGNTEMQSFLQTQLSNPGLGAEDKADVENYIRDFDLKIRKDALEAVYKGAQEYSLEKVTAAQALANFYSQRAATLSPGTPAQSTALENAGIWQNTAQSEQDKVEKQGRANRRYQMEINAYKNPPSTSQRAYDLAKMYQTLSQEAQQDGDMTEANRFMSLAQQQQTQGDAYVEKENTTANANKIKEYIAQENAKISALPNNSLEQIAAKRQLYGDLAQTYLDMGDQINYSNYIKLYNDAQQDFDKKSSGSITTSVKAEINAELAEIKQAETAYAYGEPVIQSDGSEGYINGDNLAQMRVNAYEAIVKYVNYAIQNGATGLEDDLAKYSSAYQESVYNFERRQKGQIIDVVDPKTGIVKEVNAASPEAQSAYVKGYQTKQVDKNGQMIDENVAPYYQLQSPKSLSNRPFTQQELQAMYEKNQAYIMYDETGEPITDSQGNIQYEPEQYVDVPSEDGKTERIWTQHDQTGNLVGYLPENPQSKLNYSKEQLTQLYGLPQAAMTNKQYQERYDQILKAQGAEPLDATMVNPEYDVSKTIPPAQETIAKSPIQQAEQTVKNVTQNVVQKIPEQVRTPVVEMAKAVSNPIQYVASKTFNAPSYSAPSTPPSGGTYKPTIQVNNQTMVKQYDPNKGITYQPLKPPTPAPAPAPTQNLGTKIWSAVQKPFNFLKGLF